MSKALMEKAFEHWKFHNIDDLNNSFIDERDKKIWQASATWQREQLIKELREWVNSNEGRIETDGKTWYKLVNGTDLLAKLDEMEGK